MGVFGTGLYAGDFAMDLRSAIKAVSRLPFEPDRLVEILCGSEPGAANDAADPDHTVFWLVVADRFAKRGIDSSRARERALEILGAGSDLAMQKKLGMAAAGLRQREKVLNEVKQRLSAPLILHRPRAVLKKPQPFLMEVGDVMIYPTCLGKNINPYFASKEQDTHWTESGSAPWVQDAWAAFVIIDRGRAFDFLAWYRLLTVAEGVTEKLTFDGLLGEILWRFERAGTCRASHFKRMELEKVGSVTIDPEAVKRVFPGIKPGTSPAIDDISIANAMEVAPAYNLKWVPEPGATPDPRSGRPNPSMRGIQQILSSS